MAQIEPYADIRLSLMIAAIRLSLMTLSLMTMATRLSLMSILG